MLKLSRDNQYILFENTLRTNFIEKDHCSKYCLDNEVDPSNKISVKYGHIFYNDIIRKKKYSGIIYLILLINLYYN